jgi:hypothetical protein
MSFSHSHPINRDTVLAALARHVGADRGAAAEDLVIAITESPDYIETGKRHLRAVIEDLRGEGYHICAHPRTGYFIAASEAELRATCEYLYARALCSLTQISAMQRVSLPDLRGQLRLPE